MEERVKPYICYYGKRSEMKAETLIVGNHSEGQGAVNLDLSIQLLGDKWRLRMINALLKQGAMRFTTIQKCLGSISPTVLTEQLRYLEASGILIKDQSGGKSSVYRLSNRGIRAGSIINELEKWGSDSQKDHTLTNQTNLDLANDFSSLKESMTLRKLKKNEYLLEEGSVCNFVGFVETGALRSFIYHHGDEMNNDFYLKNSVVCALTSFLSRRPTNCNIQALQDTEVLLINHDRYQLLVNEHMAWLRFAKMVSDSFFMRKCRRETSFLKHDTAQKLDLARQMFPGIEQIVPQYHIASYIGVRAESLSRSKLVTHQGRETSG